ncbi:ADP-forming succinate--CoA ligase subunit beta [Lentimicrobium sp.]|uniref:ADP-forming succinate--CoA ligase subunit beta n=1 Tax=Lentimicrobium sp. TaxID=2034841 RepID=UPI0025F91C31|nr:ADP-forming succinate--CoA ligase subunit beta [Lentimicrobium sp.]MCO5256516.1 ADP-forming succinate--CoA ligase subunit beta [Lentimicrobium sp.]HPJ62051.1 ADP-forming succinate--CoA ligase subunit beta [Lentimicrobium sp.]HPR25754.1 ADP-forming succinate--CoA ligase subunit beta [Lentimicrobium sp.]
MNLHEFQAKQVLRSYGVPVPVGIVAETPELAVKAAGEIQQITNSDRWAVKAQIHAGGRGKGGGVKIAQSLHEVWEKSSQIIGMTLVTPQTGPGGKLVSKVLVEQNIFYPGESEPMEFYMSMLLNRASGRVMIMYSTEGGMDIEEVAEKTPHLIFTEEVDPKVGLQDFQCRKIAYNFKLEGAAHKNMQKFVKSLYDAYMGSDAALLEINPVFKTSDNLIMAADCKMRLDQNALFRHPDLLAMRDLAEEDPAEVEAGAHHLNYVKLSGNVGCMVNGAGLAMATMDIIKLSGGEPANFLDVGGTANAERVEQAFRIIMKDPNVKVILVNIFGGIVRCDRVAQGIVDAYRNIGIIDIPIIVRLQGTNAEEAKDLIEHSGLKVFSAVLLQEAAELVTKVLEN